MASWYSNILTNTTSRITNLQRSVFASEADGDTDDDTHVCRVLRQYYSENGRPLPNWLPPDPKAPPPAPIIQQNSGPAASRYGAPQQGGQGGLSSLWDNNRAAGRGAGQAGSRNPFARNAATPDPAGREAVQTRPLPSQRAGSVQSNSMDMGAGAGGGGASSAQDRLRQRLYGGGARTTSPSSSTGPFAPPPAQQGGGMPSRSRGGSAANASSGDYDPYGPGGQFDSGGGGGGGGGGGNRYGGLPSGPRRMGGLPSGPRMR